MLKPCPICKNPSELKHNLSRYKYYMCNNCKLLFLKPHPSRKQLENYYAKEFDYSAGKANLAKIQKRASLIIDHLLKLRPSAKTILDVGSGLGILLNEAHKRGLKTTGIEPSETLINNPLNSTINNKYNLTFQEYFKLKQKQKYDFITLIHVIEHINNPKAFLNNLFNLLEKNGILFIETPNLNSFLYLVEKDHYTFLTPPDHLWIFSKEGISSILPKYSVILKINTYSYPEHFMGIIKKILNPQHFDIKKIRSTQSEINGLSIKKKIKIAIFDNFIAKILYQLLNINHNGSILELYINKI